jgi:hypothetical protein
MLLIVFYSILTLIHIVRHGKFYLNSKFKYISISLTIYVILYVFMTPFSKLFSPEVSRVYSASIAFSEISVYHYLSIHCCQNIVKQKTIRTATLVGILIIVFTSFFINLSTNNEPLFLYCSIAYTYFSLLFFKAISVNPDVFLTRQKEDIYFILALFLCNSLPLISSICFWGLSLVYTDYDPRIVEGHKLDKNGTIVLLRLFTSAGYIFFFFYISNGLKWIKHRYMLQ